MRRSKKNWHFFGGFFVPRQQKILLREKNTDILINLCSFQAIEQIHNRKTKPKNKTQPENLRLRKYTKFNLRII